MCGRYTTVTRIKAIEKRFNVKTEKPDLYVPNTNISHGNFAPVITNDRPEELQFFQFGFTPHWAKKPAYMINARAEGDFNKEDNPSYTGSMGIINKPMFRQSIRSKRCLVIADCFIEGPKKERLNKPYVLYLKDGMRPFAFAGIWDEWVNKETGEVLNSYAIITTVSNDLTQKIGHHRSPVIIPKEYEKEWISNDTGLSEVTQLLKPYPATFMNAYPIPPTIKSPLAEGPELLKPIGERIYKEYDYEIYQEIKLEGMGSTSARIRKNEDTLPPIVGPEGIQGELF
ncbi:MAG: SOS response-associated peptidase [Reichenbachiella sp.]